MMSLNEFNILHVMSIVFNNGSLAPAFKTGICLLIDPEVFLL